MTGGRAVMRADRSQNASSQSPGWRWRLLLGVVLALLVVHDLPVVHGHEASGFYDEDCPLERLASVTRSVPLPSAPDVPQPAPAVDSVATGVVSAAARVPFASFEPRAPPLLPL
jgi:hypothetical protein